MEESKVIRLSKNTIQALEDYRNSRIEICEKCNADESTMEMYKLLSYDDLILIACKTLTKRYRKE